MPEHRSGTCKSSDRSGARKMPGPRTSEMPERKCGARKMHEHRPSPSRMPRHRPGPYKMLRLRTGPYKMPSHRGSRKASVGAIRPQQLTLYLADPVASAGLLWAVWRTLIP